MAQVKLDSMLREFVPRLSVDTQANSVGGLLDELERSSRDYAAGSVTNPVRCVSLSGFL